VQGDRRVEALALTDGRKLPCDAVLCAVGAAPNTEWLRGSGLPADGVPVDPAGRTGLPGVWAAGDVARPYDHVAGTHVAGDHWEAAAREGAAAARSMLGLTKAAAPLPSFWSDQHGVRLQCVGRPWLADRAEVRTGPTGREFTADFTRGGRLVAGVLAGRPQELPDLRRRLVAAQEPRPERIAA
jgi:3-phenylpropionate/trans-cinnamate dioxygenase ferredoxin reductase subunit